MRPQVQVLSLGPSKVPLNYAEYALEDGLCLFKRNNDFYKIMEEIEEGNDSK